MFIYRSTAILSAVITLLCTFSTSCSLPIANDATVRTTREATPVLIQTIEHEEDECAPRLQAQQNNTQDIACLLESFDTIISNQISMNPDLQCQGRLISYGRSFPALYRALIEIMSALERTNLSLLNLNESMCTLRNIATYGLNTTVQNHCRCTGSENCTTQAMPSETVNNDQTCLLINLKSTLRNIQEDLGGDSVTCIRASVAQQQILNNFQGAISDFRRLVSTGINLPPSPCLYKSSNLSVYIKSLHTIAPYLGNLSSCEAQDLSRNISEVIFPVISELLGEVYIEELVNNSMPFSSTVEASFQLLTEQGKAMCLAGRLSTIFRRFMGVLKQEDIFRPPCLRVSQ